MPITTDTVVAITCDNEACPSHADPAKLPDGLATDDRTGWLFATTEEYARGGAESHVFCSWPCLSAFAATHEAEPSPAAATPASV